MKDTITAAKYRKWLNRYAPWHFHLACPGWPEIQYIEQDETPPDEICQQCQELAKQ
jgi:hypothetical protein